MKWLDAVLDLLFPPRCPFCDKLLKEGERLLCASCQGSLPWTEGAQGEQRVEFVDCCVSPLWYRDKVCTAFRQFKFRGRRDHARTYGTLMAQCVEDRLAGRYDLVTYAPVSRRRLRKRGYDQTALLAKEMGRVLGCPPVRTLNKCRHTRAQSGLEDDGARRANVLGAYRLRKNADVAGKRILLVDDIVTTGATLSECARILRTAGAAEIVCVTLARARG